MPSSSHFNKRRKTSCSEPEAMTIVQPELIAILAALILVLIPPVPIDVPAPPAIFSISGVICGTSWRRFAFLSLLGLAVYNPSISDKIIKASASTKVATVADKVSLSPIFNSSTATASFSLMIGITPMDNKAIKALREFIY